MIILRIILNQVTIVLDKEKILKLIILFQKLMQNFIKSLRLNIEMKKY